MLPYNVMSPEDNSDAFEELESSSSKSSDRKDSVNESALNLNEANMSATNRPTNEVNKPLIYKLDWPTRDEINASLNRYTQLLCGEKAEAELAEDKLMNGNTSLYQALLNLPLKSDADVLAGSRPSKRVTLDLDSGTRSQIVSTLFASQSLVVHAESASEESKMKMVEQNNDLVIKLMKLPFSIATEPADESVLDENGSEQASEEKSEDAELVRELSKKITDLEKATGAIVLGKLVELAELSAEVDLDFNRNDVDFEYELDGLEAFLKSKAYRYSEYFFAGGLAWYFGLKPSVQDEKEYLSIYLYAKDYAGGNGNWSVRADFEVSVLAQSGGQNESEKDTRDYSKTNATWGWTKFIDVQKLRANEYIKDDKLRVRAQLKLTNEVIRTK